MICYKYLAVDQEGKEVQGTIDSQSRKAAIDNLFKRGCFVKELHENNVTSQSEPLLLNLNGKKIKSKEVLNIIHQLSVALQSGLPLLNALQVIEEQEDKMACKKLLKSLIEQVNGGSSLSEAMSKHPEYFKPITCSMIEAGEVGGILDQTSQRLVQLLKREEQIKSKIRIALSYPIFVLIVGLLSVVFILTTILPNVIGAMGNDLILPWPTVLLLGISDFLSEYGLYVLGFCSSVVIFRKKIFNRLDLKLTFDLMLLKTPLLGKMLTEITIGRFARTIGSLGQGGITILQSLHIVKSSLGNLVLEKSMYEIEEKVKTGIALSKALKEAQLFPPLLIQVISMGEKTGHLDELLLNAADTFEEQADAMIEKCMNLLPGLLMVLLFLMIGFIALAILLPIMGMDLAPSGI